MKKVANQGNLQNQKYEAVANLTQFYAALQLAEPCRETSRWRGERQEVHRPKYDGKRRVKENNIVKSNLHLAEKMYDMVSEDRKKNSREYAPGLRIGPGNISN